VKTTDLDAIGLPTLVSFGLVLDSLVTSGKYWVTTLRGTTVLRGSNAADWVAAVDDAVFDDESSPHAANENGAIIAAMSTVARGPCCRFILTSSRVMMAL
jgi:hypothetical protein